MTRTIYATALDVDTLARTIYGEARGESQAGKVAVAFVVINRVHGKAWFGRTIRGVCRKPWQFSCWNKSDPNRARLLAADESDPDFRDSKLAALAVVQGRAGADPTDGATHYHASYISPRWARDRLPVGCIGSHLYYNDAI